jgi:DNA-binding MarR family transcriptional regulator
MVAVLEMKRSSQDSHDRVLLELASHGGWMVSSTLRRRLGMIQADLNSILEDLEKDGRIKRRKLGAGRRDLFPRELISLIDQ